VALTTANSAGVSLYNIPTTTGASYFLNVNIVLADTAGDTGSIQYQVNGWNISSVTSVSSNPPTNIITIMNNTLNGCTSYAAGSGSNLQIVVYTPGGLGNINWFITAILTQTNFA